jgi:selenide,water dikinase
VPIRITTLSENTAGRGDLEEVLHRLTFVRDPNLLAGVEDDAAAYRLREDLAIVVSVDYFNPIVREATCTGRLLLLML